MSSNIKSIVFAAILCVVCSVLLTAASTGLRERQQKNERLDRQKNLLKSVHLVEDGQSYSANDVERLYTENIRKVSMDAKGNITAGEAASEKALPLYLQLSLKKDAAESYIIPVEAKGLWGVIYGYLAVNSDGKTIKGFTVYKSSETPGLGGEIEKKWFQDNFIGKQIVDMNGDFVSVSIYKGQVKDLAQNKRQNYVDGISGASLTGKKLSAGLKSILHDYEPLSAKLRNNAPLVIKNKG